MTEAYPAAAVGRRIALFYGAIFVVLGVSLPYFPLWLQWRGLSPIDIGLITAVPLFVRIVATPTIGLAADRAGSVRPIVLLAGAVGLLSSALLTFAGSFWLILGLYTVFQVSSMAMMPLAEVAAMQAVRALGLDYGRMRLWGSITFIAANVGGGVVIAAAGNGTILPIIVAGSVLALIAAWLLPVVSAEGTPSAPIAWRDTAALLLEPRLLLIMIAGGMIQASHGVYYAFSAIHWQAQGINEQWFGVLWGIGVVAEIGLFAYAGRVLARIGAVAMIAIGALAGIARWGLMAVDPAFGGLIALQLLHGLTFGATHLGTVHAIQERVGSAHAASAQSLYSALSAGVFMGLTMLLAGAIYGPLQGASYLIMMAFAAAGGLCLLLARQPPRPGKG